MSLYNYSVIIPAFNECETIEQVIINLQHAFDKFISDYEIIVVDDGSTDNTASLVNNISGVKLIRHPYNKGNGASVKSGILKANSEKIVVIDADGQHDPKYVLEMLLLLDDYDLVVGARETFGIGRRGFGNFLVSKLASYLSGILIPDLTCGLRAFRRDKMIEFISLLPNGFSLPSTSTLAFATNGYNLKFIPINVNSRQGGKSSISVFKDGMKFIVLIFRMISLFKPLKVFIPLSCIIFIAGMFWSLISYYMYREITSIGAISVLMGILICLFGLLADQIAETRFAIGKIIKSQMKLNSQDTN
ncbi:MAG: glycosyltransferase family 2 protein [Nitrospiraceae bacterium]|nr:MAG: glycosyltransferase family 2 protein [Nitrospiraceae bacterium]